MMGCRLMMSDRLMMSGRVMPCSVVDSVMDALAGMVRIGRLRLRRRNHDQGHGRHADGQS
jgi:hypothetical protein